MAFVYHCILVVRFPSRFAWLVTKLKNGYSCTVDSSCLHHDQSALVIICIYSLVPGQDFSKEAWGTEVRKYFQRVIIKVDLERC
jgi:hypothetical protein